MSARRLMYLLAVVAVAVVAVQAQADDLKPPPWRGSDGSTFQEWTFEQPFNLSADNFHNTYGVPIVEQGSIISWQPGAVDAPWLTFQIPNRPELNPYKFIRIQATFGSPAGVPPVTPRLDIRTLPQAGWQITDSGVEPVVPDPTHPERWYAWWDVTVKPNPYLEWVTIGGLDGQTFPLTWNQVVIDTVCPPVPEPMSMTLAGLGLMGVIGGKLRKR